MYLTKNEQIVILMKVFGIHRKVILREQKKKCRFHCSVILTQKKVFWFFFLHNHCSENLTKISEKIEIHDCFCTHSKVILMKNIYILVVGEWALRVGVRGCGSSWGDFCITPLATSNSPFRKVRGFPLNF